MTDASTPTVLVVDDDEAVRVLMARLLSRRGVSVVTADDAAAAARIASGRAIDVLVTDVTLPDGSGVELAFELRERLPRLGVVIATGWSESQLAELPAGSVVVEKPFDGDQLLAAVEAARRAVGGS